MDHFRIVIMTQDLLRVVNDVRQLAVMLNRLQMKTLSGVLVLVKDVGVMELLELAVGRRLGVVAQSSAIELSAGVAPVPVDCDTVLGIRLHSRVASTVRVRLHRRLATEEVR